MHRRSTFLNLQWVLGVPPQATTTPELEFLRVEMDNLPAARHDTAAKALHAALRRVATSMSLRVPVGHHLRQVTVLPGGEVSAIIGVPRADALKWLKGSGCGGVYLRPLWTDATAPELQRDKFRLLWLRGRRGDGAAIWDRIHSDAGFVGVAVDGKDSAVRVDVGADTTEIEAQLQFLLGKDTKVRQATPGQRWWCLGPLTEAESYEALKHINSMGLTPLRNELHFGRKGHFRTCVYFAAVGQPSRLTLDNGTWTTSHARLQPADPPPRRSVPTARASPKATSQSALTAHSTWGGPRQAPEPRSTAQRDSPRHRQSTTTAAPQPKPQSVPPQQPSSPTRRSRRPRNLDFTTSTPEAAADASLKELLVELRAELSELRQANIALREEMREMRRENELLRHRLAEAEGRRSHNPYVTASGFVPPPSVHPPKRLQSEAAEPIPTSPVDQPKVDINGDLELSPGGYSPDPKRVRAPEESTSSPHGL